jgi:hypothetical protein
MRPARAQMPRKSAAANRWANIDLSAARGSALPLE